MVTFAVCRVWSATNFQCAICGWPSKAAELLLHARDPLLGLHARALEGDLAVAEERLDAGQLAQEIGLPGLAAIFAVGDRLQPDRLLSGDQRGDLAILDLGERLRRNLAAPMFGARVLQRGRAEQAADMVSPERRTRTLHRR